MQAYNGRRKACTAFLGCLLSVSFAGVSGCGLDQALVGGPEAVKILSGFGDPRDAAYRIFLTRDIDEEGPPAE